MSKTGKTANRLVWIVAICLALAGAVLIATPYLIRWYLQDWLTGAGAVEVQIADVDFNPFLGRAEVSRIRFISDDAPHAADQLVIRMSWSSLLERRVMFERIVIRDASIKVRRTETNRLFLAAVAVGGAEAVETAQDVEQASGWGIGIAGVELDNVSVHYLDPLLDYQVSVPHLAVDRMATWEPDRDTRIDGRIEIEDASLELEGSMRPFATRFSMTASVQAESVPVGDLARAFPEWGLEELAGEGRLAGSLGFDEGEDGALSVSLDGSLGIDGTRLARPDLGLAIESLGWNGKFELLNEPDGLRIGVGGRLELGSGELALPEALQEISIGSAEWDGEVRIDTGQTETSVDRLALVIDGTLVAKEAVMAREGGGGKATHRLSLGGLDLTGKDLTLLSDETGMSIEGGLAGGVAGLALASGLSEVRADDIGIDGGASMRSGDEGGSYGFDGSVTVSGLAARDGDSIAAEMAGFRWQGAGEASTGESLRFGLRGESRIEDFMLDRHGLGLVRVAEAVGEFSPRDDGAIGIADLALRDIGVLDRTGIDTGNASGAGPTHVVEIPAVEVTRLSFLPGRLELGDVTIGGAAVWLKIASGGKLELRDMLAAAAGKGDAGDGGDPPRTRPDDGADFRYRVASISTASPVTITYRDATVKPKVELVFTPMEFKIGELDSTRPAQDTQVELTTGLGRYTSLDYDGIVRPLADAVTAIGKGTVDGLDLTAFDGYSRRNNGYRVDSGTVSAEVDVDIREDQVDSLAKFVIRELDVSRIVPEEQDELGQELGVPLDVAFSLLKDKQGDIRLDVPLEGDLSELSADMGHALRIVMRKGITLGVRTAATTFFAPLWPVLAAEKVVGALSKLRFRPVEFQPATTDMTPDGEAYLAELASLVGDRPQISLRICGRSVAGDLVALYPDAVSQPLAEEQLAALRNLAVERQQRIKDQLIDRGIEGARIVTCSPNPTGSDSDVPRVDVGI